MFQPFENGYNNIISTINIGVLLALGYFYFTFSNINVPKNNVQQVAETQNESVQQELTKSAKEIFDELLSNKPKIVDKSDSDTKNAELLLNFLCSNFKFSQGIIYKTKGKSLKMIATYAFFGDIETIQEIAWGEGITGQAAKNNEFLYIDNVPKGLLKIASGLGESNPDLMVVAPILVNNTNVGMIELAGFGTLQVAEREAIQMVIDYMSKDLNF